MKSVVPAGDRRVLAERRRRIWWALVYGNIKPRRRRPPRRREEGRFHSVDWHSAHLLAVAIAVLLLSAADALLTLTLLAGQAVEINPVMGAVVYRDAALFATVKMTLTGIGVLLMVVLARYRFMRLIRVEFVLYGILGVYTGLIGYELWMANSLLEFPGL